jgi:N-acetyl-anhydromuramyl-L-alanine amidase AmpD
MSRTQVVWAVFICSMTAICAVLLLADDSMPAMRGGPVLGPAGALGVAGAPSAGILETHAPLDPERWQAIVIHHSGSPAGDARQLHRRHLDIGLDGLGYHFVIGNGNGMTDGAMQAGYRWVEQRAGAHAIGPEGPWANEHAIGICLIGNGETRPFTDEQIESLVRLVTSLQRRLDIPAERVYLHRQIADVRSPGRFFAEASFRQRLLSIERR